MVRFLVGEVDIFRLLFLIEKTLLEPPKGVPLKKIADQLDDLQVGLIRHLEVAKRTGKFEVLKEEFPRLSPQVDAIQNGHGVLLQSLHVLRQTAQSDDVSLSEFLREFRKFAATLRNNERKEFELLFDAYALGGF